MKRQEKRKKGYYNLSRYNYKLGKIFVTDFVVLDFETTGLSPFLSNIIQIGAVRYRNFEATNQLSLFVNPQEFITAYITNLTGIRNEDVAEAPTIDSALPELLRFLGSDTIIAHNAPFDMKFLLVNMERLEIEAPIGEVIDTLWLSQKYIYDVPDHKLPTLKSYLHLDDYASHEALADCYVTGALYKYCYERYMDF
ncbi:MAG: 3'-5' exonuclease [Kurthia sp.]|nr:3'-5' exonuclease [Candidatus Kurthia equi]